MQTRRWAGALGSLFVTAWLAWLTLPMVEGTIAAWQILRAQLPRSVLLDRMSQMKPWFFKAPAVLGCYGLAAAAMAGVLVLCVMWIARDLRRKS